MDLDGRKGKAGGTSATDVKHETIGPWPEVMALAASEEDRMRAPDQGLGQFLWSIVSSRCHRERLTEWLSDRYL